MKTYVFFLFSVLGMMSPKQALAQESLAEATQSVSSEQTDLEQLRQLRETLTEAVIAGDVEKQVEFAVPDVVTIWQDNRVARGHDGLRELMSNIKPQGESIFQGYTERPSSDMVTVLPGGNTAIAYGQSIPHYKFLGQEFDLENRWSATLLKTDGQWKIATYHVSGNLADNPLLTAAKKSAYWIGGIALVVGIVVGATGSRMLGKPRRSPTK